MNIIGAIGKERQKNEQQERKVSPPSTCVEHNMSMEMFMTGKKEVLQ
jgi:hypothetical protein